MIKNTNIQPLKIINVADFLNGKITVEKIYPKSAVQLFIKHRNADRGTIARALRGIRTHVPRFVARDFLGLSRRGKTNYELRVRYVSKSGVERVAPISMAFNCWTKKARRLFFRAFKSPFIRSVYFEAKREYMNRWRDHSNIMLTN